MVAKRYLQRKKEGKAFWFAPRVGREEVTQRMLSDVVDRVFDGSAAAVMLSLFDRADLDAQELRELRRVIDRKMKDT